MRIIEILKCTFQVQLSNFRNLKKGKVSMPIIVKIQNVYSLFTLYLYFNLHMYVNCKHQAAVHIGLKMEKKSSKVLFYFSHTKKVYCSFFGFCTPLWNWRVLLNNIWYLYIISIPVMLQRY